MTTRSTRSPRRRTVIALAVVLVVLSAFVIRLVDIQVVNAGTHIADSERFGLAGTQTLYGSRGTIVDAAGTVLASSVMLYDCQLDPLNIGILEKNDRADTTWPEIAAQIAGITGQTTEDVQKIVADALASDPASRYAPLKKGLSTEQYRALMQLRTGFIACPPQQARTYPNGAVAGNVLGFMSADGTPLAGLEQMQNSCLAATNGELAFQRGKDGVIIPGTETEKPAVEGGTVTLTIESDLQWYLQQLIAQGTQDMKANFGTITVVDVETGKIRAAAEYPTVDPNNVDAPGSKLRSSIFTDTFEPGSTFKGLLAAMLIDGAGQTPLSTADVSSTMRFANGARVNDSFSHPTYRYTLAGVLVDSSNAGASVFSERMSLEQRYDYLTKFGVGAGSSVGFVGEAGGLLYPANQWNNQQRYDTSYGQGLTTTIPELLGAYDAIANDGVRMPLSLVESCTRGDGTVVTPDLPDPTRVVSPESSAQTREILENVSTQANYAPSIAIPGYRLAVKTGTGQKTDGNGRYKSDVYYTTMIGFAPADDPKYLVAVTLDEPTAVRSSAANAPIWQKAMTQVLKTFRVMPSTTTPVTLPKFG